jgi:hypothetical protein
MNAEPRKQILHRSNPGMVLLNPADVVLTGAPRGKESWISRLIKQGTTTIYEPATEFSHSGIVGKGGIWSDATVIEMTWPKMREVSLSWNYGHSHIQIWRLNSLGYEKAQTMVRAARQWEKHWWRKWYGIEKLPMFLIDGLISKLISLILRRPVEFRLFSTFNLTRRLVCSQVVSRLYQIYKGISFSMTEPIVDKVRKEFESGIIKLIEESTHLKIATDGPGVTPDDIADYCAADSKWTLIYDSHRS